MSFNHETFNAAARAVGRAASQLIYNEDGVEDDGFGAAVAAGALVNDDTVAIITVTFRRAVPEDFWVKR